MSFTAAISVLGFAAAGVCKAVERLAAEERLAVEIDSGNAGKRELVTIGDVPYLVTPQLEAFLLANPGLVQELGEARRLAKLMEDTKRLNRKENTWEIATSP